MHLKTRFTRNCFVRLILVRDGTDVNESPLVYKNTSATFLREHLSFHNMKFSLKRKPKYVTLLPVSELSARLFLDGPKRTSVV